MRSSSSTSPALVRRQSGAAATVFHANRWPTAQRSNILGNKKPPDNLPFTRSSGTDLLTPTNSSSRLVLSSAQTLLRLSREATCGVVWTGPRGFYDDGDYNSQSEAVCSPGFSCTHILSSMSIIIVNMQDLQLNFPPFLYCTYLLNPPMCL